MEKYKGWDRLDIPILLGDRMSRRETQEEGCLKRTKDLVSGPYGHLDLSVLLSEGGTLIGLSRH